MGWCVFSMFSKYLTPKWIPYMLKNKLFLNPLRSDTFPTPCSMPGNSSSRVSLYLHRQGVQPKKRRFMDQNCYCWEPDSHGSEKWMLVFMHLISSPNQTAQQVLSPGTSGVLWNIVFALVSSESNCAHTPVVITKDGKQGLRGELSQNWVPDLQNAGVPTGQQSSTHHPSPPSPELPLPNVTHTTWGRRILFLLGSQYWIIHGLDMSCFIVPHFQDYHINRDPVLCC